MIDNKKIKYILPDFLAFSRNEIFMTLYRKFPHVLREKTEIYSFYGTFLNAIWNGGTYFFDYKNASVSEMKKVRDFYNKRGIVITFTFTNSLLKEEHLNDEYCNQILEIFNNGMNEILVVSPLLEKYIRDNYPKYKINRSIINTEKIPLVTDNYNLSVLQKFKNKDFDFLKSLSEEEKQRTELLCDEICINDCPYKYKHYREYAYIQLNGCKPKNSSGDYGECRFNENEKSSFIYKRIKNSKYYISYEDITKKYIPLGFQFFKLSGRGNFEFSTTEFFIEYMIKPEYQMDVRTYIMERTFADFRNETKMKLKIPELAESLNASDWTYL